MNKAIITRIPAQTRAQLNALATLERKSANQLVAELINQRIAAAAKALPARPQEEKRQHAQT